MNTLKIIAPFALSLVLLTGIVLGGLWFSDQARGAAPAGMHATVATSSFMAVGTTQSRILATSTCSSRVITTYANPIMLTFNDRLIPTAVFGHLQAASTTKEYDSGIYGCQAWRAYGYVGDVSITVTELVW